MCSYNELEDPWGVTFWSHNTTAIITERKPRRLTLLAVDSKHRLKYSRTIKVSAKPCSSGLLGLFKSPDSGPMAVAGMSDGELVVTTARVSGDVITPLNEVIVYNVSGREQYRFVCFRLLGIQGIEDNFYQSVLLL